MRSARVDGRLEVMIMSGVDDGLRLSYSMENGDGRYDEEAACWFLSIGRREDSDICLRNDTFVSRLHAYLCFGGEDWQLHDTGSTNGTYVALSEQEEIRVQDSVTIEPGRMFRIGHTWLRIEDPGT